jgi:MFS family permease
VFPLALVCLLIMGTSDGMTMVAENGIMQRRTPDAVRSRTMAAFDAVLSLGLAIAYILAGPVLRAIGPQPVYRLGGVSALVAAIALAPLVRLRREPQPEQRPQLEIPPPRYTSAEALDGQPAEALGTSGHAPV